VIEIGAGGLTREEYDRIVLDGEHVALEPGALARLQATRARMLAHVATGVPAYGVTRGLGHLVGVPVSTDDQAELQASLLTARAAGFAEPLPPEIVRGAMVVRLAGFLHGPSGVSASLCQVIAERLNESWSPVVPSGPFGAAGEIGPLAHLFQTLTGEGTVLVDGKVVAAADALAAAGTEPYEPQPKEGLALINGSPFATALGIALAERAERLVQAATTTAALWVVLTRSGARALSPRVGALTHDAFALQVQVRLASLLEGADVWGERSQPPVSARIVPQVHGAAFRTLAGLDALLDARLRGTTDSPVYLHADAGDETGFYPSGAFHALDVVLGLESLADAVCHVLNLLEKRLHRLLDARFSGLPDQLTMRPGVQAGVVALHKTVAGLAAEARTLAMPASLAAIDTSSGQEDVQSFTFLVAARVGRLLDALEEALACELVALRQAAHLAQSPAAGEELAGVTTRLAAAIEPVDQDRPLAADVVRARELLRNGRLLGLG
jgi:histidine ammonia-lyase